MNMEIDYIKQGDCLDLMKWNQKFLKTVYLVKIFKEGGKRYAKSRILS